MGKVLIDESTLTDIADSIRSKKGTTELINPANYASEISGITGGGGSSIENGFTQRTSFPVFVRNRRF